MSVKDLLRVNVGTETTWATPVAGTARLMGVENASLDPINVQMVNPDMRGSLMPGQIATLERVEGAGRMDGWVSYEDVCYFLDNLFGQATPTGAGPYTRAYAGPLGTAPAPRVLTVEHGDASGAYKLEGGLVNGLEVTSEFGSPARFSVDLIGQIVSTVTIAALADRAVSKVMGNHASVFIDAFGGTIGTTAVTNTMWAFGLKINPSRILKGYLGSLAPGAYDQPRWRAENVTVKLSLEFNTTSKAYMDLVTATPPALFQRLIRVSFDIGANLQLRFDFAGTLAKGPTIFADRDGVASVDLELNATYDPGAFAGYLKVTSINNVAVLA